jgi:hypothetical protein
MEQERGAFKINRAMRVGAVKKQGILGAICGLSGQDSATRKQCRNFRHFVLFAHEISGLLGKYTIFRPNYRAKIPANLRQGTRFVKSAIDLSRLHSVAWFLRFR